MEMPLKRRAKTRSYRVFFSHNFDVTSKFIRATVEKIAAHTDVELCTVLPGAAPTCPPAEVREALESTEALLAIIRGDTNWIANEIGIAYGLHLPIYVIADRKVKINGVAQYVTSVAQASLTDPQSIIRAMKDAVPGLVREIQRNRTNRPEPAPAHGPIRKITWRHYYELVQHAHRLLEMDINGQGGYKPTLLIGISRGGIIAADILSRLSADRPLGLLEADRTSHSNQIIYQEDLALGIIDHHLRQLKDRDARILLVDDILKSGKSLLAAQKTIDTVIRRLERRYKRTIICRSLVLLGRVNKTVWVDYRIEEFEQGATVLLPYGIG